MHCRADHGYQTYPRPPNPAHPPKHNPATTSPRVVTQRHHTPNIHVFRLNVCNGWPVLNATELPLRYPYPTRHHILRKRSAAVKRVAAVRSNHSPHMAARKRLPHRLAIPEPSGHLRWGCESVTATYLARRAVVVGVVVRQLRTAVVAPCLASSVHGQRLRLLEVVKQPRFDRSLRPVVHAGCTVCSR
jgi:hypothetical protein